MGRKRQHDVVAEVQATSQDATTTLEHAEKQEEHKKKREKKSHSTNTAVEELHLNNEFDCTLDRATQNEDSTKICTLNKTKKKAKKHKKDRELLAVDENTLDLCGGIILKKKKAKKNKRAKDSEIDDEHADKCEAAAAVDDSCEIVFACKSIKKQKNVLNVNYSKMKLESNNEAKHVKRSSKKSKRDTCRTDIEVRLVDENQLEHSKLPKTDLEEVFPDKKKKSKKRQKESDSKIELDKMSNDDSIFLETLLNCDRTKSKKHSKKSKHSQENTVALSPDSGNEVCERMKNHKSASTDKNFESLKVDLKKNDEICSESMRKKKKSRNEFKMTSEAPEEQIDSANNNPVREKKIKTKSASTSVINSAQFVSSDLNSGQPKTLPAVKSQGANKTAGVEPSLANSPSLGQWGGVTLDAADRQQKFFRLLGGFKKAGAPGGGGGAGLNCCSATGGGSSKNLAMGKEQVSELNTALESQFEKARDLMFAQQRGVGLGYAPPPEQGKKFYIDTNKTKSMKFDDD